MFTVDELLNSYNNEYVTFHGQLSTDNWKIAKEFVSNFCNYLRDVHGLNVSYDTQGSAFEGIKVEKPDEYDFLLLISTLKNSPLSANDPVQIRFNKIKARNPAAVSSYRPLTLGSETLKNPEFKHFLEKMPGTNNDIFSTEQTGRRFQLYIKDYVNKIPVRDATEYRIRGVRKVNAPIVGSRALTTVLEKGDGTEISIDMVLCAKLDGITYIPKRQDISGVVGNDRAAMDMLWMENDSLKEKEEIKERRTPNQIKNYRIAKVILKEKNPRSFILKTIFLREENAQVKPQTPYEFLLYMIDSLTQGYGAELERRNGSVTNRSKLILGRFNPNENVLAKLDDDEIRKLYLYYKSFAISRVSNQLRSPDPNKLFEELLGEKLTALKQRKGIRPTVPIG